MSDYTPETLRKAAKEDAGPTWYRSKMLHHADAWEEDRKNAEHNPWTYRKCGELIMANEGLSKRLEAAKEQADVDRSFIEQYQVEVAGLRQRLEAARPFVEAAAEEAFTGANWAAKAQAWLDDAALAAGEEKPCETS